MTWTAPRTWTDGETVTAVEMNAHVRDNLKAIGDAWTAYTPALTGVTLGNGTLTAASLQAGKLTFCRGSLTLGSTSSITTTVRIALPVTANPTASYYAFAGWVYLLDSSTPARKYRVPVSGSGVDFLISDMDYVTVNATTPWTWANGDQIMWEFFYEAA